MGADTKIAWCDHTVNFWIGCTRVGPGCDHCYAADMAKRYDWVEWGRGKPRKRTAESTWDQPRILNNRHRRAGTLGLVFTNSLADFFDNEVEQGWRDDAFEIMRATPSLVWLVLTKRPQNILRMVPGERLPMNVCLGMTAVSQGEFDRDFPHLQEAGQRLGALELFLSYEPALAPLRINHFLPSRLHEGEKCSPRTGRRLALDRFNTWTEVEGAADRGLGWVIGGGESGPGARDAFGGWFQALLEDCDEARIPYFQKQMARGRPIPPELMVREWPDSFQRGDTDAA